MKRYPEAEMVLTQVGRPDDGTDPAGFYNAEFFMPLKPDIPVAGPAGKVAPPHQGRIDRRVEPGVERDDPLRGMELLAEYPQHGDGIDVGRARREFGQDHRSRSGGIGDGRPTAWWRHCGPSDGLDDVGVYRIMGQSNLMLPIDRRKCARWNLKVGDVQAVGETAVGGKPFSQMIEGERSFDITLRFPKEQPLEPRLDPQHSRRRGRKHGRLQPDSRAVRDAGERRQQRALVHRHAARTCRV